MSALIEAIRSMHTREPISRRIMMGAIGEIAAGTSILAFTAGCDTAPNVDDYVNYGDKLTSPISRAASVLIYVDKVASDLSTENIGFGHGGIFEIHGKLYLLSAGHVTSQGNSYRILRPGIDKTAQHMQLHWEMVSNTTALVDQNSLWITQYETDSIQQVLLPIGRHDPLHTAIVNGEITPLKTASHTLLKIGGIVVVPMANTNDFLTLSYFGYDKKNNTLNLQVEGGKSCPGMSGQPILDPNSNISYGILVGGTSPYNSECGSKDTQDTATAIPFH